MATLSVYDSGERIRALFELLDHVARQAKAAGEAGTLDTLRADAFTQLLMGGQRPRVELRVTVPASVLAGVSDAPGWLHGYGPITHQQVWDLVSRSQFWRRVVTDPLTGMVREVSRREVTLRSLRPERRVALEMAVDELAEITELERQWQEAEEIAAIADGTLSTTPELEEHLRRLKAQAKGDQPNG